MACKKGWRRTSRSVFRECFNHVQRRKWKVEHTQTPEACLCSHVCHLLPFQCSWWHLPATCPPSMVSQSFKAPRASCTGHITHLPLLCVHTLVHASEASYSSIRACSVQGLCYITQAFLTAYMVLAWIVLSLLNTTSPSRSNDAWGLS